MNRLFFQTFQGFLLCLILALPAGAADTAPSVDSILDKCIGASGGKAALEKITSRTITGDLDLMGTTSAWVMDTKAPNKQLAQFDNPTFGAVADGFDGTVAWSKNQSGIRIKEGEELAKAKRDADFYRVLNLKKLYPDLAYKGTEKVDGEEVYVLESRPSASSKERFFFSASSGLQIRQESESEGPQGRLNVTLRLADYRPVDGVKYPHLMKFKLNAGGQDFEFSIKVKEVKHNIAIEDAKFTKPAS